MWRIWSGHSNGISSGMMRTKLHIKVLALVRTNYTCCKWMNLRTNALPSLSSANSLEFALKKNVVVANRECNWNLLATTVEVLMPIFAKCDCIHYTSRCWSLHILRYIGAFLLASGLFVIVQRFCAVGGDMRFKQTIQRVSKVLKFIMWWEPHAIQWCDRVRTVVPRDRVYHQSSQICHRQPPHYTHMISGMQWAPLSISRSTTTCKFGKTPGMFARATKPVFGDGQCTCATTQPARKEGW